MPWGDSRLTSQQCNKIKLTAHLARETLILHPPENFLVARPCISGVNPRPWTKNTLHTAAGPQAQYLLPTASILLALDSADAAPIASSSMYTCSKEEYTHKLVGSLYWFLYLSVCLSVCLSQEYLFQPLRVGVVACLRLCN